MMYQFKDLYVSEIEVAFPGISMPESPHNEIVFPEITQQERKEITESWKKLNLDLIIKYDLWMTGLTASQFGFFLPSFMIASLEDYIDGGGNVIHNTLFMLTPQPCGAWSIEDLSLKISSLSAAQKEIVFEFVLMFIWQYHSECVKNSDILSRLKEVYLS